MPKFVNIDHDTELLLPPNLREWVPEGHLVHFVMDAVGLLDVSEAPVNQRGTGSEQYPPRLLLGLLVYSYATGLFSSRQIERATYENVAVRLLCADTHPDHDTLCAFRRKNGALLRRAFVQVLELAAGCGILKVGGVTVAIDGTKVLANASKHSAVSHGHAQTALREIESEIARRHERKARLLQAKAEMEARAHARFQAEQAAYEAVLAKREASREAGKKPRGREPKAPDPAPGEKDQVNFTDSESRIMKTKDGFQQCYNAQAGVETDSRLIVGARVTQAPNDKEQLEPTLAAVREHLAPAHVLVDSGFVSEAAIRSVEQPGPDDKGEVPRVLAAVIRERHGRTIEQLEKREDPPAPPPEAPFTEQLAHRTATAAGRALYKLRQQTVEPVFGIIKSVLGFRRFMMRGLAKVSLEWDLVSLAYNLKRLHRLDARLQAA